ncbi:MAG TPA: M14 family zinc carboxypeptidase [Luteitalea sp.]|nr:M14 family zinc carboxypeptidase [Luteitalea sp.]
MSTSLQRVLGRVLAVTVLASAATCLPAYAQDRKATLAAYTYDPAIPTLTQVVGHDHGAEVTSPEEIAAYMRALAAAAPTRTKLVEYGSTWEGRPLQLLAIAAPERISALDTVTADLRRLADPRGVSEADTNALIARTPVVVALLHSVHGNEISPAGAALLEAYHLLAVRNDPRVDAIRSNTIVLIDPLQNPDGRGRFVQGTRSGRAATPDTFALSAEHDEPWPGGRGNHYFFDLNRDWFAHTQPESRGKVEALLRWMPHVVVDLHEMGAESSYYFPPTAVPGNAHTTPAQYAAIERFGRAIAGAFDERGFPYFNREVFDAFYPGYGVSWPVAQGAIGMTFEKSSARGLSVRRDDGSVLTYLDGIVEHFTAAMTTAHVAATSREQVLREFVAFRRSAIEEGERSTTVRHYVLLDKGDPGRTQHLATLLHRNGIEVQRTTAAATIGGRAVPAGSFVVPHGQPAGRLVRNLLDERTDMPEAFVKEQAARRLRRLPDQIYDVTAWSLPLLYDIDTVRSAQPLGVSTTPWAPTPVTTTLPAARVAYLLPWNSTTAGTVASALRAGLRVRVAGERFTLGGRTFPVGTAIVRIGDHASTDVRKVLKDLADASGAEVVPIDSAFAERGISLGSNQVQPMKAPRVLLAWDTPVNGLSAGWARYVLERRYGVVPSAVRVASLARAPLEEFDVLVLPSGSYASAVGADLVRRLKDWVSAGGTLITLGDATRWATTDAVGLVGTTAEWKGGAPVVEGPPARPSSNAVPQPIDLAKAIEPTREMPTLVPGAIANTVVDTEHWLSSGLDDAVPVSVQGQRIFSPLTIDKGRNVVVFAPKEKLVASGIFWEESQTQLPGKPYLMHLPLGRGHVVAFTDDPNNRAFAEASQLLFINAVLLGPAM